MNDVQPRLDPRYGTVGLVVALFGALLAFASQFVPITISGLGLSPLILVSALLYLVGAFVAVAARGYRRGDPAFWQLRVIRILFAAAVVFAIFQSAQQH